MKDSPRGSEESHSQEDPLELAARYLRQRKQMGEEELYLSPGLFDSIEKSPAEKAKLLMELYEATKDCDRCGLCEKKTNYVFGTGSASSLVMFIGEAPGREEDLQGEPFVGRAGQLLNKILTAIGLKREEVYIGNILKCRPPENRDPLPGEIEACLPHLYQQIDVIKPKIIVALGRIAAQTLLKTNLPMSKLRGRFHDFKGYPFLVTYHTAALLRNPEYKKPTWEDMKILRRYYDKITGEKFKFYDEE
jgi:uracil-DNA glycosylase family 4